MKKALSVLLAAAMLLSTAACGSGGTPTPQSSGSTAPASSGSTAPAQAPTNQIIYGATSSFAGDWGYRQWSSTGADVPVIYLIDAYKCSTFNQNAEWMIDTTVVKEYNAVTNADNTKTYTITLNNDLKFNNGDSITAKNYLAFPLLFGSPVAKESGAYATAGKEFLGYSAYMNGEAPVFSGLRLIDEYTFSITIDSQFVPFFYDLYYLWFEPISLNMWLGEGWDVADDGQGCYFKGPTEFTGENLKETVDAARFISKGRISSGPYQFVSFDIGAGEAILEINPNYKGNFEGQKPSIQKIIIHTVDSATMLDSLKTGGIDIIDNIGEGEMINAALDLAEGDGFDSVVYKYNGYMKLFFAGDFGPTQFLNVRKAIAHLTNREEICQECSLGYGTVVNGQYSQSQWMTQEHEEELLDRLNPYSYSYDTAIKLLEQDGWVYNEKGEAYTDGIRYKKVTAKEAENNKHNVTLPDGTILMPLIIEWCGHAQGEGIEARLAELIDIYMVQSPDIAKAGMKINRTSLADSELLSYLNRSTGNDAKYGVPTFGFISLASGLGTQFNKAYTWTLDPDKISSNKNRFFDEQLDKLSMDMIYGVEAGDNEKFAEIWLDYQQRYNELLPELPLFNWAYASVYNSKLKNYTVDSIWTFSYSILYATIG